MSATPMKKAPTLAEASPYKSVAEELETFQRMVREICHRYAERIEGEIGQLRDRVVAAGTVAAVREKSAGNTTRYQRDGALERVHELRDMLALLRNLPIKPAEGRRKDLKKVESVIEDLQSLAAKWG